MAIVSSNLVGEKGGVLRLNDGTRVKRIAETRRQHAGFTLIELLVVITILGILSAVVVFAVRGSTDKGQDAAVATDERTIRTALEVFCAKNGHYPGAPMGGPVDPGGPDPMNVLVQGKYLSDPSTYHSLTTGDTADTAQGSCPGTPKHYKLSADPPAATTNDVQPPCADDGLTWCTESTLPGGAKSISRVSCTDDSNGNSTCVALGYDGDQVVYRGTSAGTGSATINWTQGNLNLPSHPNIPGAGTFLADVDCVDASFCLAGGTSYDGNETRAVIMRTTDGGKNWTRVYLGSPYPETRRIYIYAVSCPSRDLCVVVGPEGLILKSTNPFVLDPLGTVWSPPKSVPDRYSLGSANYDDKFETIMEGLDCVASSTTCLAVAGATTLLRTTDGGENWSAEGKDLLDYEAFHGVSCLRTDHCVVDSYQSVYHYAGGGYAGIGAWKRVYGPKTWDEAAMMNVSCSVLNRCFVVGLKGFAVRSADGGLTWGLPQTTPAAKANLYGVSCTPTRCRAVGYVGDETVGYKAVIQKIRVPDA